MAVGYAQQMPSSRSFDEPKMAMNTPARTERDDTPDHHTVGSLINLLNNDMAQLIEEIGELRARLVPIRAEPNTGGEKRGIVNLPVSCKMAAELGDVYQRLSEARSLIYLTTSEIDL